LSAVESAVVATDTSAIVAAQHSAKCCSFFPANAATDRTAIFKSYIDPDISTNGGAQLRAYIAAVRPTDVPAKHAAVERAFGSADRTAQLSADR
jgi:hypothetical protein